MISPNYSKLFMVKCKNLDISKICPPEVSILKIELNNAPLPSEFKVAQQVKKKQDTANWEKHKRTVIKTLPVDIKRITGILNKISDDNYDKMVKEAKTFDHADKEVVTVIFKKILAEPFFSDIYAKLCKDLDDLHEIINERCIIEFNKSKHKNLGKFIGELYKIGILKDLNSFLCVLMEEINEEKLETLCKIIETIGTKNRIFVDILKKLDSIKTNFSPRYKYMILDIIEGKKKKDS